jgi:3-phenylpropionate/trans-cinnamate dioxygenase ferredoxin reductase subunit
MAVAAVLRDEQTCVIVGAGAAGATAALTLRSEGFEGRVVIVGDEEHPPYNRPPLSKAVVRGELEPDRAHLRPAKIWERKDVEMVLGRSVTEVAPERHAVRLSDGETLRYDKLLLATGGRARTLPDKSSLDQVHTLRTLDDALKIRELVCAGASLAIAGAGFIGAELAASAVAKGCQVTVFEPAPTPLSRALPASLGEVYARLHSDRGVDLRLGVGVARIVEDAGSVRVLDTSGATIHADAVVVAVGIEPDVALAGAAGLAIGDGVLVDERCRTSAPDVYAAGDVANHPNPLLGRRLRVEHWQNAQHQAAAAARCMLGMDQPFAEVPWVWSDQYEFKLEIAGLADPGDDVVMRGDPESLDFTAFLLREGVLAAAVGVNRAEEVRIARRFIASRVTPPRDALADPSFDLGELNETALTY